MSRLPRVTAALDTIIANYDFKMTRLSDALPPFTLDLSAGENNIISSYLDSRDMGIQSLLVRAGNDSSISMRANLLGFNTGTTAIDTITANIFQTGDTLVYRFHVGNRAGTLDQWARVNALGRAYGHHTSLLFNQQNIDGNMGYRFGFIASWAPDRLRVQLVPTNPIIGYKTWTVNDSNFVTIDMAAKHFDADLEMHSTESSIHLYTEHDEHNDSTQEDLILKIKDIKLAEWIAVNPFAPPVAGDLSADMRFGWSNSAINGEGLISLTDLFYNKQRVGSFDLGVDLSTNKSGTVRANASLMVDSIKTITAEGNLNDSTARNPFLLDFKMIHFPLHILNPFLPKDMARLNGTLNGTMDITGSLAEPIFNGYLDFDSTMLTIPMFGTSFTFSDAKIPMDSNVVTFDNYTITGANANPLSINGTVDARHISNILLDLSANAREMQIVNSKKKRGVQVYGKAFIDLDASVRGTMSRLGVKADLSILDNTNVTYIMESATDNLTSRSNTDMVKFVNFADTTLVQDVDTVAASSMMMSVDATLNIRQGSTIGIDLSTDGKNRVQLLSQGTLNYNMSYMGDTRLTGRLNLNGGYVRYTPPFMSEKLFDFQEGSYVSFNGNMLNPYLNIRAIDVLRANVQQEGQNSRLINFDVILSVTNSLDNMNVAFDLATDDDITVANELQSMSAEQRANQAMNLLLYNVYTGPGTHASSSLNGNPLFSFLESQVNSWAANNIKGVDLSFGIDQYDRTVNGASSTTTSYSYKVSKSLFNDRFKISVGGNYASDADSEENMAQNLISDISFEYDITSSGS
ncbi:MAG: translocation/assembly module TamB, partial [Muribaculaceae bacterium]|nr:translocation/assembly module TamB [Muribaculaceae bacterium]